LYSTESGVARRRLIGLALADFQNEVLSLATSKGEASHLASSVLLHFKGMRGEEEAYLARLTRRSQDPRVQTLAADVGKLRAALAGVARATKPGAFDQASSWNSAGSAATTRTICACRPPTSTIRGGHCRRTLCGSR